MMSTRDISYLYTRTTDKTIYPSSEVVVVFLNRNGIRSNPRTEKNDKS